MAGPSSGPSICPESVKAGFRGLETGQLASESKQNRPLLSSQSALGRTPLFHGDSLSGATALMADEADVSFVGAEGYEHSDKRHAHDEFRRRWLR